MFLWGLILFVSVCSAMDLGKLLFPRLINTNDNRRVTHYCSESQMRFKERKQKECLKKKLVKKLQKKAQTFEKQLTKGNTSQQVFKNPYELHVERLLQEYTKTFQECKKNHNLLILLSEFDFNVLKKDKYRSVCIWLLPSIMAFADPTFDQEAKMIFLPGLFQKCIHVVNWEQEFLFNPQGVPYNDIHAFLKLIILYNMMTLAGCYMFVSSLKARHPQVNFDTVNFLDVIAEFDCIVNKRLEIFEQKDPKYHAPEIHLKTSASLKLEQEKADEFVKLKQEKTRCHSEWKKTFDQVWLICLYWKYRQILRTLGLDPIKQAWLKEFLKSYAQKRLLDRFLKILYFIVRPFKTAFNRFDRFVDKMLLMFTLGDDYYHEEGCRYYGENNYDSNDCNNYNCPHRVYSEVKAPFVFQNPR